MNIQDKNNLVEQYEPLINKLVKQFYNKVACSWEELKSMAYEGFAIAIRSYDEEKSNMNFTQYAAFAIRNNILTSLDNELRIVKLSAYAQKKAIKNGETLFNSVSIDHPIRNDEDDMNPREIVTNMYENENFSNGNVFDYLYTRLETTFSERDYTIFYKAFGLKGYEETPGRIIAKEYGVSEGLVSQRLKKVITFIRRDKDLCEMLSSLIH